MRTTHRKPDRAERIALRIFRALLSAYPPAFRTEYGTEMTQVFRDQLRAAKAGGAGHLCGLFARTLADIALTAGQERSEEMRGRELLLCGAIALGMGIAWVDSRPGWDDTGITVGILLLVSALFGVVSPKQAWHWGLAVGLWIPLYGFVVAHNYGTIIALIPAFLGAYVGAGLRTIAFPPPDNA